MSSKSTFIIYVAVVLILSGIGYGIERSTKQKISRILSSKLNKSMKQVVVVREKEEQEISLEDVVEGDFVLISAKEIIPTDGVIIDGSAFIDESIFTGASISQEKGVGERIVQGSRVLAGKIKYQVTNLPRKEDAVQDIHTEKRKDFSSSVIDMISKHYIWFVLVLFVIATFIYYMLNKSKEPSDVVFIANIVIGYPCIMYFALSFTRSLGVKKGLEYGSLLKEIDFTKWKSLNWAKKSQVVILDKTGTITEGQIVVKDIYPLIRISEDKLLQIAASLESKSNHLASEAILNQAERKQIELIEIDDATQTIGFGIKAKIDETRYLLGNETYIKRQGLIEKEAMEIAHEYELDGKSPIFIGMDHQIIGLISVIDSIRSDCVELVAHLKQMDFQVAMLTGDDQRVANMVAQEVGIEEVYREDSAQAKEKRVKTLKEQYNLTVMIGNGRNDVEALIQSDIGIALPDSDKNVIHVADIILMNHELQNVTAALQLCSIVYSVEKQNWMWIGIYHAIGILVSIGVIFGMKGILLSDSLDWVILGISLFVIGLGAIRLKCFQPRWYKVGENCCSCTKTDKEND